MSTTLASLGGIPFRINPDTVSWQFAIDAHVIQTIGGKVVQVFGASVSHMTVSGSYGQDHTSTIPAWKRAEAFVSQVTAWGNAAASTTNPKPLRFIYAPRGWDFNVFVSALNDTDGGSITHTAGKFSYKYSLDLFVANDNSGITKAPISAFISRLSDGIGWQQSAYNGPGTNAAVQSALGGSSLESYLEQQFASSLDAGG